VSTAELQPLTARQVVGREVISAGGGKIGTAQEVYIDETDRPEWLIVRVGLLGTKSCFVPLAGAHLAHGALVVPFEMKQVKDAPRIESGRAPTVQDEAELYDHYGYGNGRSESHVPAGVDGPAVTRSEEELSVNKVRHEAGRVRLRRWVEKEPVEMSVPVLRERARIEREPITEANAAAAFSGPALRESVHEEVLYEEQVVTHKQVVPKERVRVARDMVVVERTVTADRSTEWIALEEEKGRG
jgi:uncharacterized protein (TIGR02271 family)